MKKIFLFFFALIVVNSHGKVMHLHPTCQLSENKLNCEIHNNQSINMTCSLFMRYPSSNGDRIITSRQIAFYENETKNVDLDLSMINKPLNEFSADVFCKSL